MKVFISGSISKRKLNKIEKTYLECIVEGKRTILISDAFGVDKAVQQYLFEQNYRNVIVYFSDEKPRNNIGNWQTKQIANPENLTGRSRYQLKDKAMAEDCDSGLMFWDGKSKGTKANIDYMEELGKYHLYLSGRFAYAGHLDKMNSMIPL
jgi:uncharacterized protein YbbC (DUF1343 family)